MTNSVLPPKPGPQEVVNVDVLSAFPEAYLGLSGKSADLAREVFRRLGPERPQMSPQGRRKYNEKLLDDLAAGLWKQVHPFRRWFTKPPPYYAWSQSKQNPNKRI